jgi:hypothetical protein
MNKRHNVMFLPYNVTGATKTQNKETHLKNKKV